MQTLLESIRDWWRRVRGKIDEPLEIQTAPESVFSTKDSQLREVFADTDSAILNMGKTMKRLRKSTEDFNETAEAASDDTAKFKSVSSFMLEGLAADDEVPTNGADPKE